mmetsp:Transcript_25532/g.48342  ORF Transcript_25532/g.48342 Transcript_25532/m.48342 type:complete len:243 (-) Transcript_25532:280-1008(-)
MRCAPAWKMADMCMAYSTLWSAITAALSATLIFSTIPTILLSSSSSVSSMLTTAMISSKVMLPCSTVFLRIWLKGPQRAWITSSCCRTSGSVAARTRRLAEPCSRAWLTSWNLLRVSSICQSEVSTFTPRWISSASLVSFCEYMRCRSARFSRAAACRADHDTRASACTVVSAGGSATAAAVDAGGGHGASLDICSMNDSFPLCRILRMNLSSGNTRAPSTVSVGSCIAITRIITRSIAKSS